MLGRRRQKFLWSIGAAAFLLWVAGYGSYSGMQSREYSSVPSSQKFPPDQQLKEAAENQKTAQQSMPSKKGELGEPQQSQSNGHQDNGRDFVPNFLFEVNITDVFIAIFAGILCYATFLLFEATRGLQKEAQRQERHFKVSERAYVKISHNPPGIRFEGDDYFVTIQIKNHGRTPARVTDFVLTALPIGKDEPLPKDPPYERGEDGKDFVRAFLVANDEFYIFRRIPGDMDAIEEERTKLLLFGYVDYIDSFGMRHRGGYGRFYKPKRNCRALYRSDKDFERRSNLFFISEDTYNYDRPRNQDEGNDW